MIFPTSHGKDIPENCFWTCSEKCAIEVVETLVAI
jgi:hypothetical protein